MAAKETSHRALVYKLETIVAEPPADSVKRSANTLTNETKTLLRYSVMRETERSGSCWLGFSFGERPSEAKDEFNSITRGRFGAMARTCSQETSTRAASNGCYRYMNAIHMRPCRWQDTSCRDGLLGLFLAFQLQRQGSHETPQEGCAFDNVPDPRGRILIGDVRIEILNPLLNALSLVVNKCWGIFAESASC